MRLHDEIAGSQAFAFCESVHATAISPWHIRRLTRAGKKLGGGISTASLCGRILEGWDLDVQITQHHLTHACPDCVRRFRAEMSARLS